MFTKNGQASRVSIIKEIAIGTTMGVALGFWWQTYHWNEAKKVRYCAAALAPWPVSTHLPSVSSLPPALVGHGSSACAGQCLAFAAARGLGGHARRRTGSAAHNTPATAVLTLPAAASAAMQWENFYKAQELKRLGQA